MTVLLRVVKYRKQEAARRRRQWIGSAGVACSTVCPLLDLGGQAGGPGYRLRKLELARIDVYGRCSPSPRGLRVVRGGVSS
jgi:hypothetical protein